MVESQNKRDLDYWQAQGCEAIFAAAWEMAVAEHRRNGGNDEDLILRRGEFVIREITPEDA